MKTLKWIAVVASSAPPAAFGASAQEIHHEIHIGPGGFGIDTGGPHHGKSYANMRDSQGCRDRVIRYHRGDGDVVTRREWDC